jgi:hypothetical protein
MQKMRTSTNYVFSVILRPKNFKIWNNVRLPGEGGKIIQDAVKWSQICRKIELIIRFWNEFTNFILTAQFKSVFSSKYSG